MGENVPYTSYLSQIEYSFIEKCNFCDDLKLLKNNFLGMPPLKKILASTRRAEWTTSRVLPSHVAYVYYN
jgi:hypothetical protein